MRTPLFHKFRDRDLFHLLLGREGKAAVDVDVVVVVVFGFEFFGRRGAVVVAVGFFPVLRLSLLFIFSLFLAEETKMRLRGVSEERFRGEIQRRFRRGCEWMEKG